MPASAFRFRDRPDIVLLGQFFTSLFESELFSVRDRLATLFAGIVSLLAAFGLVLPLLFNHKYHVLNALPTGALFQEAALADKLMFICISFVVTVLVTSLQWQSLFPSTQDFLILCPLPLHRLQIFCAKFLALLLFISLLNIGLNSFPAALMPGIMSGQWLRPSGSLWHVSALFLSCCFAGLFAFFALITLQALFMNLLPGALFARFSLFLQALLLLASLSVLPLLLWLPDIYGYMQPQFLRDALRLPPLWFLGWEEELLGVANPAVHALALRAKVGLGAALFSSVALYALTYARNTSQIFTSAGALQADSRWHAILSQLLHRAVKSSHELAVISFTVKTLLRSRIHKMLLCAIVGVSLSLSFDSFSSLWIAHIVGHEIIHRSTLEKAVHSTPLVISFFLLCGLRFIFLLPVESRSSWTFRLSAVDSNDYVVDATEKALLLLAAAPILLVSFVGFSLWLGVGGALLRCAFVLLMCLILSEALLWNWDRIPFACPYLPAKRNIIQSLLVYALALSFFAYVATTIELAALASVPSTLLLFASLLAIFLFLRIHRRGSSRGVLLKFDDLPEPEVQTLQLQPD
jgi:hypothetical protein